jgi:hypothetical protein
MPEIPSCLRDWDWEVRGSRPAQAKKVCKTASQWKKAGYGRMHLSIPVMVGSLKIEDGGSGQPGRKARLYFQNNQTKKIWRCSSSGRASA